MATTTQEHLDTVNQLELDAHTKADDDVLEAWRAEVGMTAEQTIQTRLGNTATHALVEGAVVDMNTVQEAAKSGEHAGNSPYDNGRRS